MAKMTFTVDDKSAKRLIDKAVRVMSDFRRPLAEVGTRQQKTIQKQFSSEGREITGGWAKRTLPYPHPVLNKTGKLKGSISQIKLTKNEVELGSKISYFKYHQTGTKKMPQRQILGFNDSMEDEAVQIIINYINNQLRLG